MKRVAAIVLFSCFALVSSAVDFTALLREKPLTVSYTAEKNINVSFMFTVKNVKESKLDIYLHARYIINADTLNDYLYFGETYTGMIKELYLEAGDSVQAFLYLNNEETAKIENLKGSFSVKAGPGLDLSSTGEVCRFTGTVWKDDQLPLFRIAKADEKNQQLTIDVELTENYEFDKLFMKIKVVSPAQGILLFSKELMVNEEPDIPFRRKTVKIDFPDLEVQKAGSYYVQVFHLMGQSRVNGVESISYRLTDK
ncbi:MAG: hypothetical protein POELPBGB_03508 [Bacteroidia bacterium]|nr:hypothetical protein [Bacteroidia bacterium]